MKKFLEVTTTSSTEMIAITGIACMFLNAGNRIEIEYVDGSQVLIAGSSALADADMDIVADTIIAANESKWTSVVSELPTLSQTISTVTFTVA